MLKLYIANIIYIFDIMTNMKIGIIQQVFTSARVAQKELNELTSSQKNQIKKDWDIEHAYYSSSLEGSKVDRKEFEKLGNSIE